MAHFFGEVYWDDSWKLIGWSMMIPCFIPTYNPIPGSKFHRATTEQKTIPATDRGDKREVRCNLWEQEWNGISMQLWCLTLGKQQADPCKWKALIRKKYLDHNMDITWCYHKNGAFNWFDQRIRWSSPTSRLGQSETRTGWWKSVTDLWIGFQS